MLADSHHLQGRLLGLDHPFIHVSDGVCTDLRILYPMHQENNEGSLKYLESHYWLFNYASQVLYMLCIAKHYWLAVFVYCRLSTLSVSNSIVHYQFQRLHLVVISIIKDEED